MNAIAYVHEQLTGKKDFPKFKPGDNITVNYKIIEGNKERIQSFKGDVIKKQGTGHTASFTVRKISDGVGVERVFPIFSPNIESIVLNKTGQIRRAENDINSAGIRMLNGWRSGGWIKAGSADDEIIDVLKRVKRD